MEISKLEQHKNLCAKKKRKLFAQKSGLSSLLEFLM